MVLRVNTRESRSPPGLQKTDYQIPPSQRKKPRTGNRAGLFVLPTSKMDYNPAITSPHSFVLQMRCAHLHRFRVLKLDPKKSARTKKGLANEALSQTMQRTLSRVRHPQELPA
jgi:hypothetical protein